MFPYGLGTLILRPNISLPMFEPPFPKSSSLCLSPPHRTFPSNSPSACVPHPFLKEQIHQPLLLQGLPQACVPCPTLALRAAFRQCFPNLPPQKVPLP